MADFNCLVGAASGFNALTCREDAHRNLYYFGMEMLIGWQELQVFGLCFMLPGCLVREFNSLLAAAHMAFQFYSLDFCLLYL